MYSARIFKKKGAWNNKRKKKFNDAKVGIRVFLGKSFIFWFENLLNFYECFDSYLAKKSLRINFLIKDLGSSENKFFIKLKNN